MLPVLPGGGWKGGEVWRAELEGTNRGSGRRQGLGNDAVDTAVADWEPKGAGSGWLGSREQHIIDGTGNGNWDSLGWCGVGKFELLLTPTDGLSRGGGRQVIEERVKVILRGSDTVGCLCLRGKLRFGEGRRGLSSMFASQRGLGIAPDLGISTTPRIDAPENTNLGVCGFSRACLPCERPRR